MLKTGIHRRDQLSLAGLESFFGRRRFVAATLYPEVAAEDGPDREALLGHILRRFPGPAGTYKRTERRRFDAFDAAVVECVLTRLGPERALAVHDLAVSDGGTSVDLFERLAAIEGIRLRFTASDLAPDVLAVRRPGAALSVVLDPVTLRPLQVIRPPFVFNVTKPESPLLYPLNRALLALLSATEVRRLIERHVAGDADLLAQPIRLIAPDAVRLGETDDRFRFERHDVLRPLPARYGLVRAMNILNPGYFDPPELRLAIAHVRSAVEPGGLFATGSNQDAGSPVDGAIYERAGDGFRLVWTSAGGSPVDRLIRETGLTAGGPGMPSEETAG